MLKASSFDIVISDLLMPGMDGIALTKKIKAEGMDVPVIVVTGFATIERAVETMQAGASDFIIKPLNFDHINHIVKKTLDNIKNKNMALKSEFYKKLSNSDDLTGLANQRYFKNMLEQEIERAERYARPLSLMMLDIDNFKICNDTYGHLFGDVVLKQISLLIKKNTRGIDLVARYGGEEFTVILPETPVEEAVVVAERVRDGIERFRFKTDEGTPVNSITVTIGVSSFPDRAKTYKELIKTADEALYAGKTSGKNRIIIYHAA